MLTSENRFVSADVERLINQIILEDSIFEREMRSTHREKLVLPINLKFMNGLPSIAAFSRNLSTAGACLITRQSIELQMLAMLQIYRLNGHDSRVVGECRWCKPFGHDYWMSGWQFLRVPRNM